MKRRNRRWRRDLGLGTVLVSRLVYICCFFGYITREYIRLTVVRFDVLTIDQGLHTITAHDPIN